MTQPPSYDSAGVMAHDRRDPGSRSPSRLLKGTCSLIFEGQSFVPDGGAGKEYWLQLSNEMHEHLTELLAPLGWQNETETFEVEFFGTLCWVGHGCGHLGVFGGIADIHEIVSVHFTPTPPRNREGPPRGICGMINVPCLRVGITKAQLNKVEGQNATTEESRR